MKRAILVLILLIASFSLIYAQEAPSLGEVYSGKVIEPDKYVLGPGDVLRIFVVQENNKTESFTVSVSPTGFIFLPLVGSIKVLNLTLSDATKEISRQLVRFYPRSNIYVDLINVKKVNIVITGEVANPGNYKVSALSTLDDVLKIAGGLKASASYRRIVIKRGEKVLELDYLKFLKYGDTSQNPYVEEGDFIYVPLMGDRVKILGRVKSPGEYEVKDGERLKDVLDMAGGLAINASLFDATLDRVDGTRIYLDLYGLYYGDKERKDKANIELKDGDSITVLTETKRVYVLGFVANPGPIQLVEEIKTGPQGEEIGGVTQAVVGAKISELIKEAGGVLPNGSTRRIELRRGGKESDKIIIDLYRVLVLGEESEEDIKVNPGDVIYVPPVLKSVKILGQVRNPGVYEIVEGDRIREILLKAGGLTEKAAREGGELVRLENGKKLTYKFNVVNALQGIEKDNLELKDGDTLYIPELRRLVYVLGQVNNPDCL